MGSVFGLGVRFIPAWAGNARRWRSHVINYTVHPRVGGERQWHAVEVCLFPGSSPRGRGTHCWQGPIGGWCRFIPAWAGNASKSRPSQPQVPVHPRVGGERNMPMTTTPPISGSSPRGRGTRLWSVSGIGGLRFIPAWAGNAGKWSGNKLRHSVHPRVGGERPDAGDDTPTSPGSSPRGRGTRLPRSVSR